MTNKEVRQKEPFLAQLKQRWAQFKEDWKDPVKKRVRNRKIGRVVTIFFRTFILIGLAFVILLPIIQKISFAFRSPFDITNPQVIWIPDIFSTDNITIAMNYLNYFESLKNSVVLAGVSMVVQVFATAVAGYAFARLRFRGNNIIFFLIIFTLVVPNETLNLARFLFFNYNKFFGIQLLAHTFAIYIMSAFGMGLRSAIFIFLFRQFFRNIPVELEESAEIDGAGVIRTFWSVMLPNARGAIVTVSLFAFVWQYNDYYWANLFRYQSHHSLLSYKISTIKGNVSATLRTSFPEIFVEYGDDIGEDPMFHALLANTSALLMMLPLLIAYFWVQKAFVESIERTGLTGM
ncbi:MAG TPA: carbohydrate ABC transporter permease [Acholeplasmataceae bacterium]|nr:carbohydrate ABC transporter permease [Acholeplasmataceae bacterium]